MKTIVVPLDGSDLAEQALSMAAAIATKHGGEIVLTTAIAVDDKWVNEEVRRQWEAETQAGVEAYLRRIANRLQEQSVRTKTRAEWGRPHVVIESVADQEGADLIVMTTHGRSGVVRWILGSVADKVLRTTSTPLMLIHPSTHAPASEIVRRIVVALDGSHLAELALPEAERFARAMNASILLVRAVVPPAVLYRGEFVPGGLPVLDELETEAKQYLERAAERIRGHGVEVDQKVATGIPAEVLLDVASDNGADLIVMTTHGRSGLDRWMFGSVADAVVRHGELPVLVIRSWVSLAEEERPAIPVAGSAVVPPPALTETEQALASPETRRGAPRPHRPERSPGR